MKQIVLACILLAACTTCTYNQLGCTGNANLFETEVTLKIALGEKVCNVSGLAVLFEKLVSDSRCPEGANCFTEGQVKVLLLVLHNDKTLDTLKLSSKQPLGELTILERDYLFVLKDVDPYPVIGKPTPLHKYSLDIEITPKGE